MADGPAPRKQYRIGGQFVWITSGRILAALIQALLMLLLVRAVAPSEFGFFAAAYGVVTVAQTSFDMGLATFVIRERARDANEGMVTSALHLNNRFAALLAVFLLATTLILALTVDPRYFLLLPLGVWAAAERNADVWLGVVFADGDARINTTNLVSRRLGNLALFALLTYMTAIDPILAFAISSASAACVSWLFAHLYVAKRLPPRADVGATKLLKESWPYWINSVATQARNLDTTLMSIVGGTAQGGFYAAASRLTSPLRILPTSLASVLLPAASRRSAASMGRLLKLVGIVLACFAVMYVIIALVIPYAVPALLGHAYVGAVAALQITAVGLVFASAASLLGSLLQGVGFKHYVATTAVVTTLVCLIGVGFGGFLYGAAGAAIGLSISYVVQSVILFSRLALFVSRKEENR